jgi:PAS domain S-box-containing protein
MPSIERRPTKLLGLYGSASLLLSFSAIINWLLRSYTQFPGITFFLKLAPTTALSAFVLSSLILIHYLRPKHQFRFSFVPVALLALYSASVIAAYFLEYMGHPEAWIVTRNLAPNGSLIGAMSPLTALTFILLSGACIIGFCGKKASAMAEKVSVALAFIASIVCLMVLFSSTSGIDMFNLANPVPMSYSTALTLLLISLAIMERADRGLRQLLRIISGISQDDKIGRINQHNAVMYAILVLAFSFSALAYLRNELKTYKLNLREQLVLSLETQVQDMNTWLRDRNEMLREVHNNPDLQRGMQAVVNNNIQSQDAVYALTWMHILFQQNPGSTIALFDVERDIVRAAPQKPSISKAELRNIQKAIQGKSDPFVQAQLKPELNTQSFHDLQHIRFWTSLHKQGAGPLLMLQVTPEELLAMASRPTYHLPDTYTLLLSNGLHELHFLSKLPEETDSRLQLRIRDIMRSNIYKAHQITSNKTVLEAFDYRGRQNLSVIARIDYLPWILVQDTGLEHIHGSLRGKAWSVFWLYLALLMGASMFMHQSSRQRIYRDNLRVSNQWRATFDAAPDLILLLDVQHRIMRVNRTIINVFGLEPAAVIGQDWKELIPPPHDADKVDFSSENTYREVLLDGRWFSVTTAPLGEGEQDFRGYISILSDITASKTSMELLQSSEERFRTIFDRSPIGISIVSKDLRYLKTNSSYQDMLGYSDTELQQLRVYDVTHPYFYDQDTHGIQALLTAKIPVYSGEKKFIRKDGSEIWAQVTVVLIYDSDLQEQVLLAMVQNIQDRVLAMQELFRAKDRAVMSEKLKSSFMQNMSHEFRTPLNGIMGFSQLLMQSQQSQDDVKDFAGYIHKSGKRMLQLVENILDFAKIDSGQEAVVREAFSLSQMMRKMFDLYKSPVFAKGLELHLDIPEALTDTMIVSDESKLLQIMAKLLDNAMHFTEQGTIVISCAIDESIMIISVKDTGIGISQNEQIHIFDSFYQVDMSYTRTHEGAGLGLPICKGLAKLLGGDITLTSEPGRGSTFSIRIPIEPDENPVSGSADPQEFA